MKTTLLGSIVLGASLALFACGGGSEADDDAPGAGGSASGGATASGGASSGGSGSSASGGGTSTGGGSGGEMASGSCTTPSVVSEDAVARGADGRGEVTQSDVCVPGMGLISSITLRYRMDTFFGDATRTAVFAYHADFSIGSATWFAQVFTTAGDEVLVGGEPVYVSWLEGSWPEPGGEFGFDITGSPWWNEVFGFYDGGTALSSYVDEATAKSIYQAGFTLDRLRVVEVNDEPVLY